MPWQQGGLSSFSRLTQPHTRAAHLICRHENDPCPLQHLLQVTERVCPGPGSILKSAHRIRRNSGLAPARRRPRSPWRRDVKTLKTMKKTRKKTRPNGANTHKRNTDPMLSSPRCGAKTPRPFPESKGVGCMAGQRARVRRRTTRMPSSTAATHAKPYKSAPTCAPFLQR